MNGRRLFFSALLVAAVSNTAVGQEPGLRTQLEARGLPSELVGDVEAIAADMTAQGMPTGPLADKAIEGWAKHVPPQRIAAVVRQYAARMVQAREAVRAGGVTQPSGHLIQAATQAMAQGIDAGQVRSMVHAAPSPEAAGPGLSVATALAAQGMATEQAVAVVVRAMQRGEPAAQILDMPSLARTMQMQGMTAAQVGQRMMQGGPGMQGRPAGVPAQGSGKGHQGQRRP
jgi:hypothetical protein